MDSGASANFISKQHLIDLEIDWDLCKAQNVRLADGKVLKTCGQVELQIRFGRFTYSGVFNILQENVPFILGMQFFRSVKPQIDWARSRVSVGKFVLPVCTYGTDQ